ncbi:hypothetical protein [Streptomyces sp. NPDC051569]|uniref:hypothetical protein n=1 Tax=Streptomyces sp. NPDC051569 TaxID=3365661 RepID=UPI00379D61F3
MTGDWISVVVILGLIVIGVTLIHLVNGQHRNRIAVYSFGRNLWSPGLRAKREQGGAHPVGGRPHRRLLPGSSGTPGTARTRRHARRANAEAGTEPRSPGPGGPGERP